MTEFTSDEIKKMRNSAVFFGEPGCQVFREALDHIERLQKRIEELEAEKATLQDPVLVRVKILSNQICVPDDLVWLHDTHGKVADLRNRIVELEDDLAELEAERRWIPVSEREPEENRYVLVTDGSQVFEAKCYKKFDELKWVWQGYDIDENITHWQYKPQPPKEGE